NASLSPQQALGVKKLPIDSAEWQSYFDESGQLLKSRDYIASQILDRGLDPSVRSEAWKFLTGYYAWRSSHDERLAVDSMRRCVKGLCYPSLFDLSFSTESDVQRLYIKDAEGNPIVDKNQLEKILLMSYMCNVKAEYQQGFHEMLLLFHLLVEKEYEIYWLFQFFLQKTENSCIMNIGVEKNLIMLKALIAFLDPVFARHLGKLCLVQSLFPWFCLFFQRVFRSFDDVWRLWEVFLTGLPCRNFQVIIAYTMLNMVRDQILSEDLNGDDILMLCNHIVDLDADTLIIRACSIYDQLLQQKNEVKNSVAFLY
uniref:TBC1 domain family member 21 n=1 Tax=Salvator merianae TaxID=96440 RepID=A0A8D0BNP6_SALMN